MKPRPTACKNWLGAEQARRNAAGQDRWEAFAGHREQIAARLLACASAPPGKLCVLGAGNSNDLELGALGRAFAEVHLVDIDEEALARGVARQADADPRAVRLHGGIDLTGCWDMLGDWSPGRLPADEQIQVAVERAMAASPPGLGGLFDVAVSTCLASQLIEGAVLALGPQHPRVLELILAIRTAHLRLLAELLVAGGKGILIADFVSSETLPELLAPAEPDWPELLQRVVASRNFFHGLNPFALVSLFRGDPLLAQSTTAAEITGFWRWRQGTKTFAVCAIGFRRAE
ncbi:MAG TPA: hypothetical protein VN699_02575 [Pirellulales bacterium]|nr:hypothetical protein [Pirellulales bacterium]